MRSLAELCVHDVGKRLSAQSVLVLPLGAVEAHGPHLPLATDLLMADAAVRAAVDAHGDVFDLWSLPALGYTKSNEHAWAPGTFWLSAQTMLAVLDDLGRSAAMTPARTLVFVNAHGGNSALLQVACRDLRLKYGLRTFLVHPWRDTKKPSEFGMGIHGGHDETSLILHLRPDLVDMTRAIRSVPEPIAANTRVRWGGSVSFGWLSDDFEPQPDDGELPLGIIGDPCEATPAHGAALFAAIIADMGETFAEIAAFPMRSRVGSG